MANKINKLIEKIAAGQLEASQQLKREPAEVLSVNADGKRAVVRLLNGSEPELLNKSAETLTAGDNVWVEYRVNPSSGYIVLRNDEAIPLRVYSTAAHRIGTWIDGSPLYERTYEIPQLGSSSSRSVSVPLGIENLGEIVESRGQLIGSGFSRPLECMPIGTDGASAVPIDATCYTLSDTDLTVYNGTTDRSSCKAYVTVRYTHSSGGYSEIEYIRSTGQQFVDTDIYMDLSSQRIEFDCMFSNFEPTEFDYFFGAGTVLQPRSSNGNVFMYMTVDSDPSDPQPVGMGWYDGGTYTETSSTANTWETRHTWALTGGAQAMSVSPVRIFGVKGDVPQNDIVFSIVQMTLYSAKIYDNTSGTLLHNLVPAQRDTDGHIGLLDKITGSFYDNGGSAPFVIPT